jgi:hypothetical protein
MNQFWLQYTHIYIYIYIYIYGNATGNSLCSYLKQAKISFFSFTKSENRRVEQVLLGGLVPEGERRRWGKGVGG